MEIQLGRTYRVLYRNYKGEVAWRNIKPLRMEFKVSSWHSENPALYLVVLDTDRMVVREFKPDDILKVKEPKNRWKEHMKDTIQ
ncbi:hypothetical protein TacPo2_45 [Pantoea bacteriophage TacPo2]